VSAQELTAAAARLRDGTRFDGELIDADNPDLLRHCADLFRLRLPLAVWLESWDGVDVREHGPVPDDYLHAVAIARAINGGAK
jgi:hypothetical protein